MSVIILRRPPKLFFKGSFVYFVKAIARKVLKKTRGPEGVMLSLQRGLDSIGYEYKINTLPTISDTVHVISNIEALKWAINEKKAGRIHKLIAGPNLVIIPTDFNNILSSPEIDSILITSQWCKDFYISLLPTQASKIHIWPAGVKIPPSSKIITHGKPDVLVFKKSVPENIYNKVISTLEERNIKYTIIEYGKFSQEQYFDLLDKTRYMIYLQEVESQGIALQEAWARNVPTLVWNKGSFQYPSGHIVTGNVSAPFQTEETGMFFKDAEDFNQNLDNFILKLDQFNPRQYCEQNLSDEASARIYVKIVES